MYNHWDSYPSGLGVKIYAQAAVLRMNIDNWVKIKQAVRELRLVDPADKPTPGDVARLAPMTNLNVGEQSVDDWYCLLREAQGNLIDLLSVGYMLDAHDFIYDSLFCEWGYILNLDTLEFEIWQGFQHAPDPTNRYGTADRRGYYPCVLVAAFPLATVTEQDILDVEKAAEEADKEA
jgi:hypothetical protein